VAALATFGLLLAVAGCGEAAAITGPTPDDPVLEYPARGASAPALCPPVWESAPPLPRRGGLLVPEGGTEALLCRYPLPAGPGPQILGGVRALADPRALIAYLNGLPSLASVPPGVEAGCPPVGRTQHTIVIGYPDRPPAIVRLDCGVEQGGNIRYGGDLATLSDFFDAG
jgi:hypothetical protein